MQLHFQLFDEFEHDGAQEETPLIIIPGLFGSVANWRSIAKGLSASRPVYVIDQRNHGRSPHADTQSYADMVSDLREFIGEHELGSVHLAGHSMGGKVAMLFALEYPDSLSSLCVLDIAPVTYTHSHAPFLEALLAIDLSQLNSRAEADRALQQAIPDTGTRLFLLQSLAGSPEGYSWRINLSVLHEYMDEIVAFPEVERSTQVTALVVAGANSTYLRPEHHPQITTLFPKSHFKTVADAGHWLHAEQPKRVLEIIEEFLK